MRKALFLDRDGVINEDRHFVHTAEQCIFQPGIFELCAQAQEKGYLLIVVTNQSGIARGLFSEAQFLAFTRWMHAQFAGRGITLTQTYYCPHHPEAGQGKYRQECDCRKPKPGMILQAAREHGIDVLQSILIGDKDSDVQAGRAAKVGNIYRLGTNQPISAADAVISVLSAQVLCRDCL